MLERIEDYFLTEPERLVGLVSALFYLGGWLILSGLVGNVASAVNGIGALGGHVGAVKTLADIYPSFPTWWVPESIIGAVPALLIIAIGFWLNQTGKRICRFMGKHREY